MEQYFNEDIDSKQYAGCPNLGSAKGRSDIRMVPLQVKWNGMKRQVTCYLGDNDSSNMNLPACLTAGILKLTMDWIGSLMRQTCNTRDSDILLVK